MFFQEMTQRARKKENKWVAGKLDIPKISNMKLYPVTKEAELHMKKVEKEKGKPKIRKIINLKQSKGVKI